MQKEYFRFYRNRGMSLEGAFVLSMLGSGRRRFRNLINGV